MTYADQGAATGGPLLVVDDDADARSALTVLLGHAGYEVLEAEDGQAALDLLLSVTDPEPRAILLDVEMPVMSGWELLAIVKSYHRLAKIPVIVLTGHHAPTDALEHGVVADWARKPVDGARLLEKLTALVGTADEANRSD